MSPASAGPGDPAADPPRSPGATAPTPAIPEPPGSWAAPRTGTVPDLQDVVPPATLGRAVEDPPPAGAHLALAPAAISAGAPDLSGDTAPALEGAGPPPDPVPARAVLLSERAAGSPAGVGGSPARRGVVPGDIPGDTRGHREVLSEPLLPAAEGGPAATLDGDTAPGGAWAAAPAGDQTAPPPADRPRDGADRAAAQRRERRPEVAAVLDADDLV